MAERNTFVRSLHDLGLAAWFGGSFMGAVGLNRAAGEVDDPTQRSRVANAGWARWTPVNAAAIGSHLLGGLLLTRANRERLATQAGVRGWTIAKSAVTAAALGATAYSRVLGKRVERAGDVAVQDGTQPSATTPPEVEQAQRQLGVLQWTIPALTGGVLVMNALMGEQQRPNQVFGGIVKRFTR